MSVPSISGATMKKDKNLLSEFDASTSQLRPGAKKGSEERTNSASELKLQKAGILGLANVLGREGGSLTGNLAAILYNEPNASEETLTTLATLGQVIAVRCGDGHALYPVWQFAPRGGTLPGLRETLLVLRKSHPDYDDLVPVAFFLNPSPRLEGMTPLETLRRGGKARIAQVMHLAAEAAE